MTRTISIDGLRQKVSGINDDNRRDAAAKEARRRWEDVRQAFVDAADGMADAAEEQWEGARGRAGEQIGSAGRVARPKVKRLRKRAAAAIDDVDLDVERVRGEVADIRRQLGQNLVSMGVDLRDATRGEADRIIQAIHDQAEEARAAERRKRVRALVGWTAFGMVAGAVLASQLGGGRRTEEEASPTPAEGDDDVDDPRAT